MSPLFFLITSIHGLRYRSKYGHQRQEATLRPTCRYNTATGVSSFAWQGILGEMIQVVCQPLVPCPALAKSPVRMLKYR